jgi:hypothetical protein
MARSLNKTRGYDGCLENNWASQNATPFGYADTVIRHDKNIIRCDPMNEGARFSLPYSQLWAGNLDEALTAAETGLDKIGFHPWIEDARFLAMLAMGRFKDDPGSAGDNPRGSFLLVPRKTMVLAANGDIEQAREFDRKWAESQDIDDLSHLHVAAMLGDREQANELAATMDARLAGPFSLSIAVFQCLCGAPFDIDSTPNFKARIEEAGFPWPPPTRIHYPAKDW